MLLVSWTLFLLVFCVRVVSPADISLGPDSLWPSAVPSSLPRVLSVCWLPPALPGRHRHCSHGLPRSRRSVSSRVSAYRHSALFLLLLLLCGDVEPNPGLAQPTSVKCVCTSAKEEGTMLQCEVCHFWSHCRCVKILVSLASTYPFVCPFCVKSSVVSLSSLSNRLSALECDLSRLSCKLDSISAAPSCNVVSSTISPPSPSSPPLTYSAPPRSTSSILPLPPPLVPLRTSGLRPFHLPLVLLQLPWLLLLFFHSYCSWFCPPCCSCFPSFFRCYCFTFFCHYSL